MGHLYVLNLCLWPIIILSIFAVFCTVVYSISSIVLLFDVTELVELDLVLVLSALFKGCRNNFS